MVTACAIGISTCRTVRLCRSSTRPIIARSSPVNVAADSCITSRKFLAVAEQVAHEHVCRPSSAG